MVWAAPARPWRVVAAQDSAKRDTRTERQEPSPPQTTTSAVARQRSRLRLKLQLSNTLTFLFTLGRRGAARHHPYSGHPTLAPWHIRVMRVALRGALHLRQGKL